eukprot:899806-Rhodomonas_salina.1
MDSAKWLAVRGWSGAEAISSAVPASAELGRSGGPEWVGKVLAEPGQGFGARAARGDREFEWDESFDAGAEGTPGGRGGQMERWERRERERLYVAGVPGRNLSAAEVERLEEANEALRATNRSLSQQVED